MSELFGVVVLVLLCAAALYIYTRADARSSEIHGAIVKASMKLDKKYGWRRSDFMFTDRVVYQFCRHYVKESLQLEERRHVEKRLASEIEKRFADMLKQRTHT